MSLVSAAGGFPSGQYRLETRTAEVKYAVEDGADEVDIVVNRSAAQTQDWKRYAGFYGVCTVCGLEYLKMGYHLCVHSARSCSRGLKMQFLDLTPKDLEIAPKPCRIT